MVSVQDLPVGARVLVADKTVAEVLANPHDGMWLVVRTVAPAEAAGESEYMLHFSDVQSVVED